MMSDEMLIETYVKAIELNLDPDFIQFIFNELVNREVDGFKKNAV